MALHALCAAPMAKHPGGKCSAGARFVGKLAVKVTNPSVGCGPVSVSTVDFGFAGLGPDGAIDWSTLSLPVGWNAVRQGTQVRCELLLGGCGVGVCVLVGVMLWHKHKVEYCPHVLVACRAGCPSPVASP
jgi:hypothetical protein